MAFSPETYALLKGQGGGGGGSGSPEVLKITLSEDGVGDKTWKEVHDSLAAGIIPIITSSDEDGVYMQYVEDAVLQDGEYFVNTRRGGYFAETENDYIVRD